MIKAVEAIIDAEGNVRLLEDVHLPAARRALVLILEGELAATNHETAALSEPALAEDWTRPEEEAAWSHLQPAR